MAQARSTPLRKQRVEHFARRQSRWQSGLRRAHFHEQALVACHKGSCAGGQGGCNDGHILGVDADDGLAWAGRHNPE